jgi:hypothetical protein
VNVSEPKLRLVAQAPNADQRRLYEKLLAGQLRCTRKVKPPPPPTEEERARSLAAIAAQVAEHTKIVEDAVMAFTRSFAARQLRDACPTVSGELVRKVLARLRTEGRVRSIGAGVETRWQKVG